MAKDSKRKCPDCDGIAMTTLFMIKGDGICSECHGTGRRTLSEAIVSFFTLDQVNDKIPCETCSGTKQCQTCGGGGFEYYNEIVEDDSQVEDTITDYDYDILSTEDSWTSSHEISNVKIPVENTSSGSSIVFLLILLFVLYEVASNWNHKNVSATSNPIKTTSSQPIAVLPPPQDNFSKNMSREKTTTINITSGAQSAMALDKKTSFAFTMKAYDYDYSDEKFLYYYLDHFDKTLGDYSRNEFELRRNEENAKSEIESLIENLNYKNIYYRDQAAFLGDYDFKNEQFEFNAFRPRGGFLYQYPFFYVYNFPSLGINFNTPTSTSDASDINLKNFTDFNSLPMNPGNAELLLKTLHNNRQVYLRYYYSFLKEKNEISEGNLTYNNGVFCYVYLVEIWGDKEMSGDKIAVLKSTTTPPEYLEEIKNNFDKN